MVITEDPSVVKQKYITTNPGVFIEQAACLLFQMIKEGRNYLNVRDKSLMKFYIQTNGIFNCYQIQKAYRWKEIDYNATSRTS